jgi:hypothetical protein
VKRRSILSRFVIRRECSCEHGCTARSFTPWVTHEWIHANAVARAGVSPSEPGPHRDLRWIPGLRSCRSLADPWRPRSTRSPRPSGGPRRRARSSGYLPFLVGILDRRSQCLVDVRSSSDLAVCRVGDLACDQDRSRRYKSLDTIPAVEGERGPCTVCSLPSESLAGARKALPTPNGAPGIQPASTNDAERGNEHAADPGSRDT